MVEGQSYVMCGANQGPNGLGEHKFKWCYDLSALNAEHSYSKTPESHDNAQYPAFGRKLYVPVAGRILGARDSVPDHAARVSMPSSMPSNYIWLRYGENTLRFVHNKQGSVVPQVGQNVVAGDVIAAIGDTGPATWPHVHLMVQHGLISRENYIPIVLKDVRVSLNSGGNDYWARTLKKWHMQEGYFVETVAPLDK
jgi:hypothetical protein